MWLARLTDKARATRSGKLGAWLWANPLDQIFLKFLGVTADAFLEGVGGTLTDTAALEWVTANATPRSQQAITAWSSWFEGMAPWSNERRERFSLRCSQGSSGSGRPYR